MPAGGRRAGQDAGVEGGVPWRRRSGPGWSKGSGSGGQRSEALKVQRQTSQNHVGGRGSRNGHRGRGPPGKRSGGSRMTVMPAL